MNHAVNVNEVKLLVRFAWDQLQSWAFDLHSREFEQKNAHQKKETECQMAKMFCGATWATASALVSP